MKESSTAEPFGSIAQRRAKDFEQSLRNVQNEHAQTLKQHSLSVQSALKEFSEASRSRNAAFSKTLLISILIATATGLGLGSGVMAWALSRPAQQAPQQAMTEAEANEMLDLMEQLNAENQDLKARIEQVQPHLKRYQGKLCVLIPPEAVTPLTGGRGFTKVQQADSGHWLLILEE